MDTQNIHSEKMTSKITSTHHAMLKTGLILGKAENLKKNAPRNAFYDELQ